MGKKIIHVDKSNKKQLAWENNQTLENILRNMASAGLPDSEIAKLIGVRLATLQSRIRKMPQIEEALVNGRSHATQLMVAKLFETAIGGSITQEITEKINNKGQKSTSIVTREAPPSPQLMMYWLNNCDPQNWKPQRQLMAEAKGVVNDAGTAESDKIARLSREVFESDTAGASGEHRVSETTAQSAREGAFDEEDLRADVQRETADNIQNDVMDVPAEKGTESIQAPPV
jgi:hypothetical protein